MIMVEPGGETYDQPQIPQDQVAAMIGVERAERRDCTPTEGQIAEVKVRVGDSARAEVEGSGGEDAVGEVTAQPRV